MPCCRRSDSSWVKINAGQYGYYRVRYSLSNGTWAALAGATRWAGARGLDRKKLCFGQQAPAFAPGWLPVLLSCLPLALPVRTRRLTCPTLHNPHLPARSHAPAGSGADMALSGADVAGLIEDAFALAEAGEEPIVHFLDMLL